jgi:flagellum-specific ATP synthase
MPTCNTPEEQALIAEARRHLAVFEDVAELVRLGAYRKGADAAIDAAVHYYPMLERFLAQDKGERASLEQGYEALRAILANKPH